MEYKVPYTFWAYGTLIYYAIAFPALHKVTDDRSVNPIFDLLWGRDLVSGGRNNKPDTTYILSGNITGCLILFVII